MKKRPLIFCSLVTTLAVACELQAPCEVDEIYSNGICVKCLDYGNHHFNAEGACVQDTVEACGMNAENCTAIAGAKLTECREGKCMVLSCEANLVLNAEKTQCKACGNDEMLFNGVCIKCWDYGDHHIDASGTCVPDTLEACGMNAEDCTAIAGAKQTECRDGKCSVLSCEDDLVLNAEKTQCRACSSDEILFNGVCIKCWDYGDHHLDETGNCVMDSNTACGAEDNDCTSLDGVDDARCIDGKCEVLRCKAELGYRLDATTNRCQRPETYSCGPETNKQNCFEDWLPGVYPDNDWANGSTLVCLNGDCAIGSCDSGYLLTTCGDYKKQYEAAYRSEYGADFTIPLCENDGNDAAAFCMKYICPVTNVSGQKIVPGVCGCDLEEDTGDNDHDGIMNCFDACPTNPTKWDKKIWWDQDLHTGIRCEIWDTDRDGVDDAEDACPTKKGVTGTGANCGIETVGEDGVPEFHIYSAKDFERLRVKLNEIYNSLSCTGETDECTNYSMGNYKSRRTCINNILHTYSCDQCTRDGNKVKSCTNQTEVPIGTKLRIILENNINLDDAHISILSDEGSEMQCYGLWPSIPVIIAAELDGNGKTIRYLRADTNDEAAESGIRCSLMDAFIDKITLSKIHNLKLDFDMKGYGRALFANQVASSEISDVSIVEGTMESLINNSEGTGGLFGVVRNDETLQELQMHLDTITATNLSIIAENADRVGGLFGYISGERDGIVLDNIHLELTELKGHNSVGGLVGQISGGNYNDIEVISNQVKGNYYIGGLSGTQTNSQMQNVRLQSEDIQGVKNIGGFSGYITGFAQSANAFDEIAVSSANIRGNDNVGGFAGSMSTIDSIGQTIDPTNPSINIRVNNDTIRGRNNVGGFAGYGSVISWLIAEVNSNSIEGYDNVGGASGSGALINPNKPGIIINTAKTITGNNYVGGLTGSSNGFDCNYTEIPLNAIFVYNNVDSVIGKKNVGGLEGTTSIGSSCGGFAGIYNRVKSITGNMYVGGLSSYMSGYGAYLKDIYNRVDTIKHDGNPVSGDGSDNYFGGLVGYLYAYYGVEGIENICHITDSINTNEGISVLGGMFGYVKAGSYSEFKLENVHVQNLLIDVNAEYCTGLIGEYEYNSGYMDQRISLINVSVFENIRRNNSYTYGLVGFNSGPPTLDIYSSALFVAPNYIRSAVDCENLVYSYPYTLANSMFYSKCTYFPTGDNSYYRFISEDERLTAYQEFNQVNIDGCIEDCLETCIGSSCTEQCNATCTAEPTELWSNSTFSFVGEDEEIELPSVKESVVRKMRSMDIMQLLPDDL